MLNGVPNISEQFAVLYDRDGRFPDGIDLFANSMGQYQINFNIASKPGDYFVTIGGRSKNYYRIGIHDYKFTLHVLPDRTNAALPTALIILFVVSGLFITYLGYVYGRKLLAKRKHS
jgi:hypothetical protein